MRWFSSWDRPAVLVAALVSGGCVSVQVPDERVVAPPSWYRQIVDSIARSSGEQEASAPRIRLVVAPASLASGTYVDAAFNVSDDAYVLVVAIDLDRRIRVLHPESPDESGFAERRRSNRLTRFFAGFGVPRSSSRLYHDAGNRISPLGGGGVLLAIASDRPLQLERLTGPDGVWDEHELSRLVFEATLPGAARAIGYAVVLTGQSFNTDYATFDGRRSLSAYSSFASGGFDDCVSGYGFAGGGWGPFGHGAEIDAGLTTFVGFYRRDGQTFARYATGTGRCARPLYYDVRVAPVPTVPRDTIRRDSTVMTRRIPRSPGAPRFPGVAEDSGGQTLGRGGAGGGDVRERLRPPVSDGLRFRPPGQAPVEVMRPRHEERGTEEMRRAGRPQPQEARAEPRPEPSQREPVQREPVQREPVQREPVQREPVQREPVQREPVPTPPMQSSHR